MIRVLHIVGKMDIGGLESMIMNYYKHIDRSQVAFDFISLSGASGYFDHEIFSLGGTVFYPPEKYDWKNPSLFKNWFDNFLLSHNYDILHSHNGGAANIIFPLAKKYGLKIILHSHNAGTGTENYIVNNVRKHIRSYYYKYVDLFLACSLDAGQYMFRNRYFQVLNNAIDLECYEYNKNIRQVIRNKLSIKDDTYLIGVVGRLTAQKNPKFILDLMKKLSLNHSNIKLLWVGDGELYDDIHYQIIKKSLDEEVLLIGSSSKVNDLYQAMDLFILPSLNEGLGIVAIEAQASGLEVLCSTNVPALAAVTDNCEFIETNNLDAWEKRIEYHMNNRIDRSNYFDIIRNAGFDISFEANKLLDYYKQLVMGK